MSRRWNNCLPNNRNNKQPHIRKSYFPSIWKKGKDKPLLIKSHADDTTIYASCHPSDLHPPPPQNWRSQLCAQCPQLLVYWLSPSTHPTKTKTVVLSTSQISRVPSSRISSRSLERVNLTKLLGIHFSVNIYLGKTACPKIVKSPVTVRLAFYGKLKALQEIVT